MSRRTRRAKSDGGWTEDQIAQAYGLNRLYAEGGLGTGQTIDLLELEPFRRSDLATFDRCFFGASHVARVNAVHVDGFGLTGDGTGEALLDVEVLSALAPNANIDVYETPNTSYGAIDAYEQMVSSDSANLISTSWGECETVIQLAAPGTQEVENYLFEEAAAQGQTVFAASGDTGSDDCAGTQFQSNKAEPPYLSVDDPASQPDVVGVGGTSLRSDIQPLDDQSERAWNDGSNGGGGGGGISASWASPSWQAGSGVPGISSPTGRLVPDVSAVADENHGVTIYSASFGPATQSQSSSSDEDWQTIGGTSGAAPIWAAIIADIASSSTVCPGLLKRPGGADLGFVEPELYAVASTDFASAFHDVTAGNNDVFGLGFGYPASSGFNMATGLGSPIVTNASGRPGLARLLCEVATDRLSTLPNPVVTGISPSADGPTTGGNVVTISGTGFDPSPNAKIAVSFGSAVASVQTVSSTSVTVTVPPSPLAPASAENDAAGAVDIVVTVTNGSAASSSVTSRATQYEYFDEQPPGVLSPSVSGVGPSGGNMSGGNRVVIYGSGFSSSGIQQVTFGGIPAESFVVVRSNEIRAVVPAESQSTACAAGGGFEPTAICQVEVSVTTTTGVSATDRILPPETGPVVFGPEGVVEQTPGFEIAPASTEYDYAPTPRITSITPNPTMPSGRSPVVIAGSGFSLLTFDWVNFGPATSVTSQQLRILSISATSITINPPSAPATDANPTVLPGGVSVETASGLTNVARLSYAGVPELDRLSGFGGSVHGGAVVRLDGRGLGDVTSVGFVSELPGAPSVSVASTSFVRESATSLEVRTPPHEPGPVAVVPCTLAGCARSRRVVDTFIYYSSSRHALAAIMPAHGAAKGGTVVTLFGKDVRFATAIVFGRRSSNQFESDPAYPANDPEVISVVSPAGPARHGVRVVATGPGVGGRERATKPFRYEPSAPSAPVAVSTISLGRELVWQPPESDGGSRVVGYVVSARSGATSRSWSLPAGARSFALSNLATGHTYHIAVAAVNAVYGRGLPTNIVVTIPA